MPNPQMTCKALKKISNNCTVLKISKNFKYTFTQTNNKIRMNILFNEVMFKIRTSTYLVNINQL